MKIQGGSKVQFYGQRSTIKPWTTVCLDESGPDCPGFHLTVHKMNFQARRYSDSNIIDYIKENLNIYFILNLSRIIPFNY